METKIISLTNQKGGVGKTTSTATVGSILASKGYKVLVIDLDAQANLTMSLLKQESEESIYYAMTGKSENLPIISVSDNLSVIPADIHLAMAEIEMTSAFSRERILDHLLDPIKRDYDFILIDCPPSLGLLTLNAFTASNIIIVPLVAEVLPFKGLLMINKFLCQVRQHLNPAASISGILLTRWESTRLSRKIEKDLRCQLGDIIFTTKIRKNITVAEAPALCKNLIEYAPNCNGAKDYIAFTDEFLGRFGPST